MRKLHLKGITNEPTFGTKGMFTRKKEKRNAGGEGVERGELSYGPGTRGAHLLSINQKLVKEKPQ